MVSPKVLPNTIYRKVLEEKIINQILLPEEDRKSVRDEIKELINKMGRERISVLDFLTEEK